MASNLICWCILTIFGTDYFRVMVCWFFSFWYNFYLSKQVKCTVSRHFRDNVWEELDEILAHEHYPATKRGYPWLLCSQTVLVKSWLSNISGNPVLLIRFNVKQVTWFAGTFVGGGLHANAINVRHLTSNMTGDDIVINQCFHCHCIWSSFTGKLIDPLNQASTNETGVLNLQCHDREMCFKTTIP